MQSFIDFTPQVIRMRVAVTSKKTNFHSKLGKRRILRHRLDRFSFSCTTPASHTNSPHTLWLLFSNAAVLPCTLRAQLLFSFLPAISVVKWKFLDKLGQFSL
jgi:hypothetical protein